MHKKSYEIGLMTFFVGSIIYLIIRISKAFLIVQNLTFNMFLAYHKLKALYFLSILLIIFGLILMIKAIYEHITLHRNKK